MPIRCIFIGVIFLMTLVSAYAQTPDSLKSLIDRVDRTMKWGKDDEPAAITALEQATATADQPAKAILQNITATLYWYYVDGHRDQIYDRTPTAGKPGKDIRTWSAKDLHERIRALYLASLADEEALKRLKTADYAPIIIKGKAGPLRPTLFDVLAQAALDYFITGEGDIGRSAESFEIEDPAIFADAEEFATHVFMQPDSSSCYREAITLLQELARNHLNDPQPDVSIDIDLKRLWFARNAGIMADKEELYRTALTRLTDRWGDNRAAAEAWYQLAKFFDNKANWYDPPGDTSHRYDRVAAAAICKRLVGAPDSSEARDHASELLGVIRDSSLFFRMEEMNVPEKPILASVDWKNLNRLYGQIIRLDLKSYQQLGGWGQSDDSWWEKLFRSPVVRSFTQELPKTSDYQDHRVEIKIDALPTGMYALLTRGSTPFKPGWKNAKDQCGVFFFQVSAISYIHLNSDFFVLDRETGQPRANAVVQVWNKVHTQRGDDTAERGESYHTDLHGHFRLNSRDYNSPSFALEVSAGKDHLYNDHDFGYFYPGAEETGFSNSANYEREHRTTWLFTDRSIYRPGQIVYFKGIVITRDSGAQRCRVVPHQGVKIVLSDANSQEIDTLGVTTNDFGSYHGEFRLPVHSLNGEFSIKDTWADKSIEFSVEEYKRPKFTVGFDSVKSTYRVGDSIRVQGFAQSFAGNMLDGATVSYRVVREVHYFYRCPDCERAEDSWGWAFRGSNQMQELAHGTMRTDGGGCFQISFAALPDKRFDPSGDPVFEYWITADVTDINGETHSGQTDVKLGYRSLMLSIGQPSEDHLAADSLRILVDVSNLSGVVERVRAKVAIYPLQAPSRLIRKRYWEPPDQFVLSRDSFEYYFPHDEYGDESRPEKWQRGAVVVTVNEESGKSIAVRDSLGRLLPPGRYLIEAQTSDRDGREIKVSRYIELYDAQTGRPAQPEYSWGLPTDGEAKPGEVVSVKLGTSAGNVNVMRTIVHSDNAGIGIYSGDDRIDSFQYLALDNRLLCSKLTVSEEDRGGFEVIDAFVRDNRLYTRQYNVHVPWTNKQLAIRYSSFRDKVTPGSREKWSLTIRGVGGDKKTAELLTGMYDASLDQFRPHEFTAPVYSESYFSSPWNTEERGCFSTVESSCCNIGHSWSRPAPFLKNYDRLLTIPNGWGAEGYWSDRVWIFKVPGLSIDAAGKPHLIQVPDFQKDPDGAKGLMMDTLIAEKPSAVMPIRKAAISLPVRKNFQETAFFLPDLRTDSAGNVSFSFTMPESLTQWKWMTLAHTRDLAFGYSEKTIVTQKELMVQPNAPRFLREGDKINFSVKVVNLTDSEMTGQTGLELTDPTTGETDDGLFINMQPNQYFTVPARGSVVVEFPLQIPYQYNRPVSYRVVAQAGAYSDGEEAVLPVVSNRMLVTETLPLNMPADGVRSFRFDKLLASGGSETLNNHALTVEFTANPAWYAVQALPYLMEYPYECAEQTWDRLYANAVASKIVNGSPRIAQVFERWRTVDTSALLSNLEKNQELKSVLLEETPWVLEGKTETQQKKNIALLFDLTRVAAQLETTVGKLSELQASDGGFPWFKDGPEDRYVTQYILTGMGRLLGMKVVQPALEGAIKKMICAALGFADREITQDYQEELKVKGGVHRIGSFAVQYLYMRSLFNDFGIPGSVFPAVNFYRKLAQRDWVRCEPFLQGMIALALYRTGDVATARAIIASLKQTAIRSEELGMYWKGMEGGYYWYQAPVETEALMIEAFREIGADTAADRQMKTWLLRQKQTHRWATTKATAEACYALLMGGDNWLDQERSVKVQLGEKVVDMPGDQGEAGSGYFKKIFDAPFINPSMGNIKVSMSTTGGGGSPAWGAVYWQYFDQLDQITAAGNGKAPLRVSKRLYIQRNTDGGAVLDTIPENGTLRVGDRVVVRLVLRVDRDLEYVHLKDMRGACFEPVNVLSGYRWQGGLGYYETTKDVSSEFFFSSVPKGVYVFEYPLVAEQTGEFSNGVASVECMYAPEFADHTEGIRINVEGGQ